MKPALSYWKIGNDLKRTVAFVLAGGRGARLKQLTDWRVKPAVPFGGKYRIIDFVLSNCVNSGIRKIGIVTQYKSQSLIRHINRGWEIFHPELDEFIECVPAQKRIGEDWYSGTANAICQNMDMLYFHKPEYVLILAGDHIYKMDYRDLLAFHKSMRADVTVASTCVPLDDAHRFGVMSVDERCRIEDFQEKPEHPAPCPNYQGYALASMGIYIFNTSFLVEELLNDAKNSESSHDFGRDILPSVIHRKRAFAFPFINFDENCSLNW